MLVCSAHFRAELKKSQSVKYKVQEQNTLDFLFSSYQQFVSHIVNNGSAQSEARYPVIYIQEPRLRDCPFYF